MFGRKDKKEENRQKIKKRTEKKKYLIGK